jgi:hypothetical protein
MSDPIWEKFAKHDEIISTIQQKQAATEARMQAMEERIDRNQHELVRGLARIETKVDSTTKWMNESQSGLRVGKWIAGIIVAIVGVALSWVKFFKGGG